MKVLAHYKNKSNTVDKLVVIIAAENTDSFPKCLTVDKEGQLEWVAMEKLIVIDHDLLKEFEIALPKANKT